MRRRVPMLAAVAALPVWLTLGRLELWPQAHPLLPVLAAGVAGAALIARPRPIPPRLLAVPWLACMVAVAAATAIDGEALRWAGWAAAVTACMFVIGAQRSEDDLHELVRWLTAGLAAATLVAASSMIVSPEQVWRGSGRWTPYGVNPNQIAPLFASTIVLGAYQLVADVRKAVWLVPVALAALMLVLGGSRSSLAVAVVGALPVLLWALRRRPVPVVLGLAAAGALAATVMVVAAPATTTLEQLGDRLVDAGLESRQVQQRQYLDEVVADRPLTGRMFMTQPLPDDVAAVNSHSAFHDLLGVGGLLIAGPVLLLELIALVRVRRLRLGLFGRVVGFLFAAQLVQAFAFRALHWPTYPLAWVHLLLLWLLLWPPHEVRQGAGQSSDSSGSSRASNSRSSASA